MGYLIVFFGGGIGAALRHGVNLAAARTFGTAFPYGTITVNIVGTDEVALQVPSEREPKLTANQRIMFRLLHEAGARGLTVDEWNEQARALDIGKSRKSILWELKRALKDKGRVREHAGRWTVAHE